MWIGRTPRVLCSVSIEPHVAVGRVDAKAQVISRAAHQGSVTEQSGGGGRTLEVTFQRSARPHPDKASLSDAKPVASTSCANRSTTIGLLPPSQWQNRHRRQQAHQHPALPAAAMTQFRRRSRWKQTSIMLIQQALDKALPFQHLPILCRQEAEQIAVDAYEIEAAAKAAVSEAVSAV